MNQIRTDKTQIEQWLNGFLRSVNLRTPNLKEPLLLLLNHAAVQQRVLKLPAAVQPGLLLTVQLTNISDWTVDWRIQSNLTYTNATMIDLSNMGDTAMKKATSRWFTHFPAQLRILCRDCIFLLCLHYSISFKFILCIFLFVKDDSFRDSIESIMFFMILYSLNRYTNNFINNYKSFLKFL